MAYNLCNIVNLMTILAACTICVACGTGDGNGRKSSNPGGMPVQKSVPAPEAENEPVIRDDEVFNPDDSLKFSKPAIDDQMQVDLQDSIDSVAFVQQLYPETQSYEDSMEMIDAEFYDEPEEYEIYKEQTPNPEDNFAESRLVQSTLVEVVRPGHRDVYDSVLVVIEDRLSIRPDPGADQVVLEKWLSPVNYKGYKFNRRKLMLYGVQAHQPVGVFYYQNDYYFSLGAKMYVLNEHFDYKPFEMLKDSILTKYLLSHDRPF